MALTRDFRQTITARVQSEPAYARALLQQATSLLLQGEPHTAKLLLRDLVNASIGFEQLARQVRGRAVARRVGEDHGDRRTRRAPGNPAADVRARRELAALPGGGGTPLAAAIDAARTLALQLQRSGDTPVLVFLTDGRANIAHDGTPGRAQAGADALTQAALLRGAHHVLNLLMPYLESGQRAHLLQLVGAYAPAPG